LNFTPVPRYGYRVGVPAPGFWREVVNTDSTAYGGSGVGNLGGLNAAEIPAHGRPWSLSLTLPPLAAVFFKNEIPDSRFQIPGVAEASGASDAPKSPITNHQSPIPP